jgi:hypothetical protein
MSCERYWSDGVVLVEQGVADTHRETCEDCQRAHRDRAELIAALPLVGLERTGDSAWKARVWAEIDRGARGRSMTWWIAGLAAAAAVVHAGQLEKPDRLLQLRRHHQLLRQLQFLAHLHTHGFSSYVSAELAC